MTNGIPQLLPRQKGRRVPDLPTYTFETTGVEVKVRRLGPFTMDEIRKSLLKDRKPPTPPMLQVEIGEARVKELEPNPQDPAFIRATIEYNEWMQTAVAEKMLHLMVNYCLECEIEPEIVEDRRRMLAMIDPESNNSYSDREVYIRYYLLATGKELQEIQMFILGQSMPTPEAVQEHIDTFQGDVQGETPVLTPGAPIGL